MAKPKINQNKFIGFCVQEYGEDVLSGTDTTLTIAQSIDDIVTNVTDFPDNYDEAPAEGIPVYQLVQVGIIKQGKHFFEKL